PLYENTLFEARFAGNQTYTAVKKRLPVRAKSYLSAPVVPKGVKQNRLFEVYGYLKPKPIGETRLYFYRYAKVRHEWVFYKSIPAKNV
ncbi:hypothetical protein OFB94_30120, partial [Escherichia coli]|nr:hypothetical protein [Escherichia coli]